MRVGCSGSLLSDEDGGGTSGFADVSGGSLKTVELLRTLGDALPSDRWVALLLVELEYVYVFFPIPIGKRAPGFDVLVGLRRNN